MMKRLSHVGVAVRDLDASISLFSKLLQARASGIETVSDQHVRLGFFHVGDVSIELTEPTSSDSPVARFIGKRGEGVHHLSFEVDDITSELARLKQDGFALIDEVPRRGAGGCLIAFIHPRSTNGVLVELSQKP